jgi:hypothetical protein
MTERREALSVRGRSAQPAAAAANSASSAAYRSWLRGPPGLINADPSTDTWRHAMIVGGTDTGDVDTAGLGTLRLAVVSPLASSPYRRVEPNDSNSDRHVMLARVEPDNGALGWGEKVIGHLEVLNRLGLGCRVDGAAGRRYALA